jgi:hypothetical protein
MKFIRFLKKVVNIFKEKITDFLKDLGSFLLIIIGEASILFVITYCLGFSVCWIFNYVPELKETDSLSSVYGAIGIGILAISIITVGIFGMLVEAFRKLKDLWRDS